MDTLISMQFLMKHLYIYVLCILCIILNAIFFHICCILQFLHIALCGFKISCVCACNHVDSSIGEIKCLWAGILCNTSILSRYEMLYWVSQEVCSLGATGQFPIWTIMQRQCCWHLSTVAQSEKFSVTVTQIFIYLLGFFWGGGGGAAIFIHFFFFSKCLTFLVKHVSRLCQLC